MNNREAFEAQRVLINLFERWKGYELPDLNSDNQFDKEWLHREWVAFQAGYQAALASQEPTLKNNEFIPDSTEGRIQAAIKCLNMHWVSHDANRFDYAIEGLEKCLASLASQAQQEPVSQWQPIATAPKNKKIIVRYKNALGKDRTVFAKYLDKFTEEASKGTDCETDYCEDDDTFYCKEGWVELIDNWDDFSSVYFDSRNVPTHWMPLPPAPEGDKP